ncbi:MAG: hypothetical protein F4W90_09620 [Gammaproteobacteria bacterium]|nr:hypothetical protein [Gammaproteobacteria bacterium]
MSDGPLPVVSYLKMPPGGEPYLEGHRCQECDCVYLGERQHCSKCSARDSMKAVQLANNGTLYSYSIVHRSFPGIDVPYISAIVDLEGGGTVKGNLIGVEADPEKISFGMPVQVVYDDALGRKDGEGNSYLSYFFKPS